jgi:phosphoribosylformylglycinamidine synthase
MPELAAEAALVRLLWRASPLLSCAHDSAEGGLAVALAEAALAAGLGAQIELEDDAVDWFGEGGGQVVVTLSDEDVSVLEGMPHRRLGVVGGDKLLGIPLAALADAYRGDV